MKLITRFIILFVFCFLCLYSFGQAIDDNGTNVGIGTPAILAGSNPNIRLYISGGIRSQFGSNIAQSYYARYKSAPYSSTTLGSLGVNEQTASYTSVLGLSTDITVGKALAVSGASANVYGGQFITKLYSISGSGSFNVAGVKGVLSGEWNGDLPAGMAGGVIGLDEIDSDFTYGGYFLGKLRAGGTINPRIELLNEQNNKLEIAISSCDGCYDPFSKPGDVVFRTLGGDPESSIGGDLIFNIPGTNGNRKFGFHTTGEKILTIREVGASGKVGIGTDMPIEKLDVRGTISLSGNITGDTPNNNRKISSAAGSGSYLHLYDDAYNEVKHQGELALVSGQNGVVRFGNYTDDKWSQQMVVEASGNVGIGTDNPDEKLTVKGIIHAEEVKVDLLVPADYVFQKYYTGNAPSNITYKMPSLEEVESYTKKHNHLPGVPSADEIHSKGLFLKEMTNLLLQKIEELTLYTIEQEKRIQQLEVGLANRE